MPLGTFMNRQSLLPAIQAGKLSRAIIDDKVRRQLRLADRFRWTARPAADLTIPRLNPASRAVAYRGALEGVVLLKNDSNILPIDSQRVKTVAVIGPRSTWLKLTFSTIRMFQRAEPPLWNSSASSSNRSDRSEGCRTSGRHHCRRRPCRPELRSGGGRSARPVDEVHDHLVRHVPNREWKNRRTLGCDDQAVAQENFNDYSGLRPRKPG